MFTIFDAASMAFSMGHAAGACHFLKCGRAIAAVCKRLHQVQHQDQPEGAALRLYEECPFNY